MRLSLFDRQTVEQPLELAPVDPKRLTAMMRPLESASFEPAIMEPKSIVIPAQYFEFIALPVTEDEPLIGKRIKLESCAHESGQAVDRFSQIGRSWRQVNVTDRFEIQHADPATRSTSARSLWSNPGSTSIANRPMRKRILAPGPTIG